MKRSETMIETAFELIVAVLGLLACMVSFYAIGAQDGAATGQPEPWICMIVIVALSFAMTVLFSQVLLRIIRKNKTSSTANVTQRSNSH